MIPVFNVIVLSVLAIFALQYTDGYGLGGQWVPAPQPPQPTVPVPKPTGGFNPDFPNQPTTPQTPGGFFPHLFTRAPSPTPPGDINGFIEIIINNPTNPPFPSFPMFPWPAPTPDALNPLAPAPTTANPSATQPGFIPIIFPTPTPPSGPPGIFNPYPGNIAPPAPTTARPPLFPTPAIFPLPGQPTPPTPPTNRPLPEPTYGPDYNPINGGSGYNYAYHSQSSYGGNAGQTGNTGQIGNTGQTGTAGQTQGSPLERINILSAHMTEFLMTLTKEQLVAFFRVFYMSQGLGTSLLDPRVPVPRSMQLLDRQAIEMARSIPLSSSKQQSLEVTGLGQILRGAAMKIQNAPVSQRGNLIKEYHRTIMNLRIPKGIQYALKQAVL